jgi:hypothetical protein
MTATLTGTFGSRRCRTELTTLCGGRLSGASIGVKSDDDNVSRDRLHGWVSDYGDGPFEGRLLPGQSDGPFPGNCG